MGTSYSQGAQSAAAFGEAFVAGAVEAGSVAVASTALAVTVVATDGAGVGFSPDFVLYSTFVAPDGGVNYLISTSATTVTWTRATSTAADVITYIIGNLE